MTSASKPSSTQGCALSVKLGGVLAIFGLMLALTGSVNAQDADGWELKVKDGVDGIAVYYRNNVRGYVEFRGHMRISSSLSAFVALMRDVDNMPNWVYRTTRAEKLEEISDTEVYAHIINSMPWPLDDRDAVVHTTLAQDPTSLRVTINGRAVPDFIPPVPNLVRMPVLESSWSFTPLGNGVVDVELRGFGDAGGIISDAVPGWALRVILHQAPYQTLLGMQKAVIRPDYQLQRFDFIREPAT